MKDATRDQAEEFTDHLLRKFGGTLVKQSVIKEVLRSVLFGFDPTQIIHAITPALGITVGSFVYMKDSLTPDEQMGVIVHECVHLSQQDRSGILKHWGLYIAEPEARAGLECGAYHASLEFDFARTKQLPTLDGLVSPLRHGYFLGKDHIEMCQHLLESQATTVAEKILSTPQGIAGVEYLKANAPELLAP